MIEIKQIPSDEVDALILNAELRSELEPYYDESIAKVETGQLPLGLENEYLASMLAWETAPSLPIYQWFTPPLKPVSPHRMPEKELHDALWELIYRLYSKQIVLDFTDHLSDLELYLLICHDILPCREKMLERRNGFLHWDCAGINENPELWLTYYATTQQREIWEEMNEKMAPYHEDPPYSRDLPGDPG
ncbi:MAG: hypothetical protein Q4C96_05295 [Planctomycetia bacterium]|nr:hypothetical protein [Planctomycetia bacterium]